MSNHSTKILSVSGALQRAAMMELSRSISSHLGSEDEYPRALSFMDNLWNHPSIHKDRGTGKQVTYVSRSGFCELLGNTRREIDEAFGLGVTGLLIEKVKSFKLGK